MFIAIALPKSMSRKAGLDADASRKNLAEALVESAKLVYPFADVEIAEVEIPALKIRIYAERPGRTTTADGSALERTLPLATQAARAGERLDRVFGTILQAGEWHVPTPARVAA